MYRYVASDEEVLVYVRRLIQEYEPGDYRITWVPGGKLGISEDWISVFPKGRRRNGKRRENESFRVTAIEYHPNEGAKDNLLEDYQRIEAWIKLLLDEAGWGDKELQQALLMGFPPNWRDGRFVG